MNIPTEIFWEICIGLFCFIFGRLWGLNTLINQRVTYHQCENNRSKCPCLADVEKIQEKIDNLHPQK